MLRDVIGEDGRKGCVARQLQLRPIAVDLNLPLSARDRSGRLRLDGLQMPITDAPNTQADAVSAQCEVPRVEVERDKVLFPEGVASHSPQPGLGERIPQACL